MTNHHNDDPDSVTGQWGSRAREQRPGVSPAVAAFRELVAADRRRLRRQVARDAEGVRTWVTKVYGLMRAAVPEGPDAADVARSAILRALLAQHPVRASEEYRAQLKASLRVRPVSDGGNADPGELWFEESFPRVRAARSPAPAKP